MFTASGGFEVARTGERVEELRPFASGQPGRYRGRYRRRRPSAGRGLAPMGIGVQGGTGRIEEGYRAHRGEPIVERDGAPLADGRGRRSCVTSAGSAPSPGGHVLMNYLPPALAAIGTALAVDYLENLHPVTVAVTDATALFDPGNGRIRGQRLRCDVDC